MFKGYLEIPCSRVLQGISRLGGFIFYITSVSEALGLGHSQLSRKKDRYGLQRVEWIAN